MKKDRDKMQDMFVKDELQMLTGCFNEYYFIIPEKVIKPMHEESSTYKIGDILPVKGKSYKFPKDFNIIDLHSKLVAKIRDSRLEDLISMESFQYDELPAVNIMGFGIKLNSGTDFEQFINHFISVEKEGREAIAAFANKWLDIVRYRWVRYE